MYIQYFLGYISFTSTIPFDPSLFVEIRRRLGDQIMDHLYHFGAQPGQIGRASISVFIVGFFSKNDG